MSHGARFVAANLARRTLSSAKSPEAHDAVFDELRPTQRLHPELDSMVTLLRNSLHKGDELEHQSRRLVENLTVAMQAATLLREGNTVAADLFCSSRLGTSRSFCFGALGYAEKHAEIIERAAL